MHLNSQCPPLLNRTGESVHCGRSRGSDFLESRKCIGKWRSDGPNFANRAWNRANLARTVNLGPIFFLFARVKVTQDTFSDADKHLSSFYWQSKHYCTTNPKGEVGIFLCRKFNFKVLYGLLGFPARRVAWPRWAGTLLEAKRFAKRTSDIDEKCKSHLCVMGP